MEGNLVVTTSRKATPELVACAQQWAERLQAAYVPRAGHSLRELASLAGARGVLVVAEGDNVVYHEPTEGVEYFFHPNLARLRIHNIKTGRGDPMVTAMQLGAGDRVLDCTLGRGTDAIIASWAVGESGRVVGVEVVPLLAQLTIHGLRTYPEPSAEVRAAMRRVCALQADHNDFLQRQADNSFDIVYFDPIFDRPVDTAATMRPLRHLAAPGAVTRQALAQALRVAARRVVIKQRRDSPLWRQLPPDAVIAGHNSRIEYGLFNAD